MHTAQQHTRIIASVHNVIHSAVVAMVVIVVFVSVVVVVVVSVFACLLLTNIKKINDIILQAKVA